MNATVVTTVGREELKYDTDILDFTLDEPRSDAETIQNSLEVKGWAVGKQCKAIAVEVLRSDRVILSTPVQIHRPLVAKRYAGIDGATGSGFQAEMDLQDWPTSTTEVLIRVVLADETRLPVAVLKCDRRERNFRKKTFFIHVPKTAGSSFNKFLSSHFSGDDHCEKYRIDGQHNQFRDLEKLKKLDYISGHLNLKEFDLSFDKNNYLLTTLIRNPINQVISHLNWVYHVAEDVNSDFFKSHPRQDREIALAVHSRDLTNPKEVIKVLSEYGGLFLNNQSRFFQTQQTFDFQDIIKNLQRFDLVGITENYQNFLYRYVELQGANIYPHLDVENTNKKPAIDPNELIKNREFMEFINEQNSIDIKVYEYFYSRDRCFPNQIAKIRLKIIHNEITEIQRKTRLLSDSLVQFSTTE